MYNFSWYFCLSFLHFHFQSKMCFQSTIVFICNIYICSKGLITVRNQDTVRYNDWAYIIYTYTYYVAIICVIHQLLYLLLNMHNITLKWIQFHLKHYSHNCHDHISVFALKNHVAMWQTWVLGNKTHQTNLEKKCQKFDNTFLEKTWKKQLENDENVK